jgi:hypothetical protein
MSYKRSSDSISGIPYVWQNWTCVLFIDFIFLLELLKNGVKGSILQSVPANFLHFAFRTLSHYVDLIAIWYLPEAHMVDLNLSRRI